MPDPDPMHAYYSDRAPFMAKTLDAQPAGQVLEIIAELTSLAKDQRVLEVACGTGYFTRFVGPVSRRTTATDYSTSMLAVAQSLRIANTEVIYDDAYHLSGEGQEKFDFGFAMHWVSHIPLGRWPEFFTAFHARMKPGAKVMLADDIRRPDDVDPWYSKLATRDTFEIRHLPNGESYEIVKTFFTAAQLKDLLQPYANNLQIHFDRPRWWLTYDVRG